MEAGCTFTPASYRPSPHHTTVMIWATTISRAIWTPISLRSILRAFVPLTYTRCSQLFP